MNPVFRLDDSLQSSLPRSARRRTSRLAAKLGSTTDFKARFCAKHDERRRQTFGSLLRSDRSRTYRRTIWLAASLGLFTDSFGSTTDSKARYLVRLDDGLTIGLQSSLPHSAESARRWTSRRASSLSPTTIFLPRCFAQTVHGLTGFWLARTPPFAQMCGCPAWPAPAPTRGPAERTDYQTCSCFGRTNYQTCSCFAQPPQPGPMDGRPDLLAARPGGDGRTDGRTTNLLRLLLYRDSPGPCGLDGAKTDAHKN